MMVYCARYCNKVTKTCKYYTYAVRLHKVVYSDRIKLLNQ